MLAKIQHWPSAQAKQWARSEIPRLCAAQTTCAIVFFGSVVRGVNSPTDLDILYIYDQRAFDYQKPPIDVDLRKFESREVEPGLDAGNDLLGWCVRYGELACERGQYWSDIVAAWKGRLALPAASEALERAQKSERLLREMSSLGDDDAALELYLGMLTQLARAHLIQRGVYPASRPELPKQLRSVGETTIAKYLQDALQLRNAVMHGSAFADKKIWRRFLELRNTEVAKTKAS